MPKCHKLRCDFLSDFQTLWVLLHAIPSFIALKNLIKFIYQKQFILYNQVKTERHNNNLTFFSRERTKKYHNIEFEQISHFVEQRVELKLNFVIFSVFVFPILLQILLRVEGSFFDHFSVEFCGIDHQMRSFLGMHLDQNPKIHHDLYF